MSAPLVPFSYWVQSYQASRVCGDTRRRETVPGYTGLIMPDDGIGFELNSSMDSTMTSQIQLDLIARLGAWASTIP